MADKGTAEALAAPMDTISVKGEVGSIGQEALELYFTNKKRCEGGEILGINLLKDNQATITFSDPSGMYPIYIHSYTCTYYIDRYS